MRVIVENRVTRFINHVVVVKHGRKSPDSEFNMRFHVQQNKTKCMLLVQ